MRRETIFGGESIKVSANVDLEELLEIMNSPAFGVVLRNLSHISINGVDLDYNSLKDFPEWYDECCKRNQVSTA